MIKRFYHTAGNKFLTFVSNLFTGAGFDRYGKPAIKCSAVKSFSPSPSKKKRFGFEPEITAKNCQKDKRYRIYEIPVSYYPRSYNEGKKIGIKDAFRAIYCILKYNLFFIMR